MRPATDLVVWREKGLYAQEDQALSDVIATFERANEKQVALVFYPRDELPEKITAALAADRPPDFTFGLWLDTYNRSGRLVGLSDTVGSFSNLFDPNQLDRAMLSGATRSSASPPRA